VHEIIFLYVESNLTGFQNLSGLVVEVISCTFLRNDHEITYYCHFDDRRNFTCVAKDFSYRRNDKLGNYFVTIPNLLRKNNYVCASPFF